MNESNEIDDATLYIEGLEWFACDEEEQIGHFDTLGLRHLPRTVKGDRRTAERLIAYFFEEAKDIWALGENLVKASFCGDFEIL